MIFHGIRYELPPPPTITLTLASHSKWSFLLCTPRRSPLQTAQLCGKSLYFSIICFDTRHTKHRFIVLILRLRSNCSEAFHIDTHNLQEKELHKEKFLDQAFEKSLHPCLLDFLDYYILL